MNIEYTTVKSVNGSTQKNSGSAEFELTTLLPKLVETFLSTVSETPLPKSESTTTAESSSGSSESTDSSSNSSGSSDDSDSSEGDSSDSDSSDDCSSESSSENEGEKIHPSAEEETMEIELNTDLDNDLIDHTLESMECEDEKEYKVYGSFFINDELQYPRRHITMIDQHTNATLYCSIFYLLETIMISIQGYTLPMSDFLNISMIQSSIVEKEDTAEKYQVLYLLLKNTCYITFTNMEESMFIDFLHYISKNHDLPLQWSEDTLEEEESDAISNKEIDDGLYHLVIIPLSVIIYFGIMVFIFNLMKNIDLMRTATM